MDIKTFIKRHSWVYTIYFYIASTLVKIYKLFLRADNKLILFVCYGGRRYSDSTKVIYEAMLKDSRFDGYKIVWAFTQPEKYDFIPNRININSLKYITTALKARCWVTNVIVERALDFTGINTYYFHTTHGVLVKLDGFDAKDKNNFKSLAPCRFDCCLAQSEVERQTLHSMLGLDIEKIKILGFPKNDILVNHTEAYRNRIRTRLGIPNNKRAVLYAPTFREEDDFHERFDINVDLWKKILGDNYVLLYRAHPVVSFLLKENDDFFIDTTNYDVVEDIMIAADILVSDYSGIIFDYSLMGKPIFLWPYDYDKYNEIRGLYFDIRKELPWQDKEEDLVRMIKEAQLDNVVTQYVIPFRDKYATEYGHGTENSLNEIYKNIATTKYK